MTRERGAFLALALAAVATWALVPTFPNYDATYHLVWGRELLDGTTPSFEAYQAPTQHPLYVALCAVLSVLGEDADRVLVLLTALAHVVFVAGVFRLGRAVFSPAAGVLGAVFAGTSFALLLYAARAYVDVPFLALVLWAAVAEAERRDHRRAMALLAVAGLLRPEAWVLAGLLWLAHGRRDPLMWALTAAAPLVWAATDLAVTGDPLWSLNATSDLADELGRPQGLEAAVRSFFTFLGGTAREPVAVLGAGGLALAVLQQRRGAARPLDVPLALVGAGTVTFALTGVLGLSVLPRYLTVPAVALCLFAGNALVALWAWRRAVVVAAVVAAAPVAAVYGADRVDRLATELDFTRDVHDDLAAVLRTPEVRRARACGPVTLPNYRLVPDARWLLDAPRTAVGSRSARERDRGVALFLVGEKPLRRYGFADGASPRTNVPGPGFVRLVRRGALVAYAACDASPPG